MNGHGRPGPPSAGFRAPGYKLGSPWLDAAHREDFVVSSLIPEATCKLPDPTSKQIHLGLTCSAGCAGQAPSAGLVGQGSAHWAMARETVTWQSRAIRMSSPSFPVTPSPIRAYCPSGAPEHPPWLTRLPSAGSASTKGLGVHISQQFCEGGGHFPIFQMWKQAQKGVVTCLRSHSS